ncbi:MAG: glycosyltransferase family 4 protein [Sedimentisphaerales bacterium]|nr:glycosyltransferase family 4 protein [Sedimentisphaerales bacterium]
MNAKIAIIIERADISLGGAERSVFELRAALSALGLSVDIIAAKGQTDAKNIHILCRDSSAKRVNFFTFAEAIKKHLSEKRYDIIHSVLPFDFADIYQPRGGTYAETIIRNAASYQNKFIEYYKRITAVTNSRRTTLLRTERKISQMPDGPLIAALSEYVAEQFRRHYTTNARKIIVIPNGVKTDKKTNSAAADTLRSQIMATLKLKEADNPVLFLFVANNFRLKGLGPLIQAMQIAANKQTERRAYLVVVGHDKAKKYRRLSGASTGKNIIFLGFLNHIQNALSIVDVAVLPTFYDPSSRFILEALAAGKPVITTKFNGATDLFKDNRHGKIVDSPEDINALAEAITHFTNTDNIQKASQAIIEDNIRKEISIDRVAKQLQNIYESILQKKGLK